MSKLIQWIDRTYYATYGDRWDDGMLRDRVLAAINPNTEILDIGAGRGGKEEMNFKGRSRYVAGVDPDPAVLQNPHLDEARVQDPPAYAIPYPDDRFDVVFCNSVIEHITDADAFFGEIRRVLRPGGVFIAKTPNRHHYVASMARITPHAFHDWYNRLRGRASHDTFPTTYACNSSSDIVAVCERQELEIVKLDIVEGRPEYLRLSFPTYLLGLAYERLVNAFAMLKNIRCVIFMELRKPA